MWLGRSLVGSAPRLLPVLILEGRLGFGRGVLLFPKSDIKGKSRKTGSPDSGRADALLMDVRTHGAKAEFELAAEITRNRTEQGVLRSRAAASPD